MERLLNERQLHNQLNKYYKKVYGERITDEWHVNPADNVWKFERDGQIISLVCNKQTGRITEKTE